MCIVLRILSHIIKEKTDQTEWILRVILVFFVCPFCKVPSHVKFTNFLV